jgi:NADH-quinone oxidoreductase subunit L
MGAMGGLKKWMPLTHITFLIACLAIAGVPPLSGFFSKEDILLTAYLHNKGIYYIGLITSGITAFYMFRLYFSVFQNRQHTYTHEGHGEGSSTMKFPLAILAIAALLVGFIPFGKYVSFGGAGIENAVPISFSIAPVAMALAGIWLAFILYYKENEKPQQIAVALGGLYRTVYRKFYFDEIYLFITKKVIFNLVAKPAAWIDKHIVDGFMNLLAFATARFSERIKALQSGSVQSYALYFFGGILALAAAFIYWMK